MAHILFQRIAEDSAALRLRINLTAARIGVVIVATANCLGAALTNKYSSVLQQSALAGDRSQKA